MNLNDIGYYIFMEKQEQKDMKSNVMQAHLLESNQTTANTNTDEQQKNPKI